MYQPVNVSVNIDRIISDAENNICRKLPDIIDKKSNEITEKILKNLSNSYETSYKNLLEKYENTIRTQMMNDITPRIRKTFLEVTKQNIKNLLDNKKGGDFPEGDEVGVPVAEVVVEGGEQLSKKGAFGGKSRRNRKFRKKRKTIRK